MGSEMCIRDRLERGVDVLERGVDVVERDVDVFERVVNVFELEVDVRQRYCPDRAHEFPRKTVGTRIRMMAILRVMVMVLVRMAMKDTLITMATVMGFASRDFDPQ